jgi:uncharacterized protein YaeQ
MAIKATVFKVGLSVSDLDRHHYHNYALTVARHPSETDERMMLRLLAFALFADERLEFTRGISSADEPDLWQHDLSGVLKLWIDLGQPEEKRVRKACSRAEKVVLFTYGGASADIWWQQQHSKLARFDKLSVLKVMPAQSQQLATLVRKVMQLHCTIQGAQVMLGDADSSFTVDIERLK